MKDYTPLLDAAEKLDAEALKGLQLERLKTSLAAAYEGCAPYRAKCQQAGVAPEHLRSLEDLAAFPFTMKKDLRAAYPFGFFARPMDDIVRVHASSGTTGHPTVVGYTKSDIRMWAQVVARSIRAAGGRPGMRVHVAYGYGLFTGGLGAHYGAEALGCTTIPMSGGRTEKQVQLIGDFQPDIIMVTPSYMLSILDEYRRQGVDPRKSSLRIGIFGAEPWGEGIREEIEQAFNIDAVDIYGLSEVIGPGVASECVETKDGPTVWEDHFYPEIIDPETGRVLDDGEEGELVFTSLTKEALPIIRYRTRDLTRLLPGQARPMRRIARIAARSDDMLIVRGVNVFPSHVEDLILDTPGLAPHYEIEITRPDRLDEVTVRVEHRSDYTGAEAVDGLLALRIKDHIGVSMKVSVVSPDTLPRSTGKARRVFDRRNS
ncbi:MAG: phenylacetate--CoA ligase PaaK [Myxococcota bacterium]